MPATLVRSNSGAQNTGSANPTATLGGAATAGNLLVATVGADDYFLGGTGNRTPPTGWTLSTGCTQETFLGHYLFWKVATGGETGVTYGIGSAAPSCWCIAEYSGLTASPYDVSAGTLQQSSGLNQATPTLTPSSGDRLILASIGGSLNNTLSGTDSWTNSFVEVADAFTTLSSGTRDTVGIASLSVTANGTTGYSTTASYMGGTSVQARTAIIIAFKVAAGPPAPPPFTGWGVPLA